MCPGLSVVAVYGGVSISQQMRDLRSGADVVVGTPGRIIDLIERKSLSLEAVRACVLCVCGRVCCVCVQGVGGRARVRAGRRAGTGAGGQGCGQAGWVRGR